MSLLPEAVLAQQRGWHIFPVQPGEKTPHLIRRNAPYTIRWSEVATNDIDTVMGWWQKSPRANVGVAAKPSGLLVVDCDRAKEDWALKGTPFAHLHDVYGVRPHGDDVFNEMCHRYGGDWAQASETYRVMTGSAGLHYYYAWPEGVQASQSSPVPGFVDVRCNGGERGGYVLGAGSVTSKGSYIALNALPVAAAPAWLVELVREKPRPAPLPQQPSFWSSGGSTSFSGLEDRVRYAQEGNRNAVLLWAARSMCSDGAALDLAERLLVAAAEAAGLRESEARATVRSGYRLQGRKENP